MNKAAEEMEVGNPQPRRSLAELQMLRRKAAEEMKQGGDADAEIERTPEAELPAPTNRFQDPENALSNKYEASGKEQYLRQMKDEKICPNCHIEDCWVGTTEHSAFPGAADRADEELNLRCSECGMDVHRVCSLPQLIKSAAGNHLFKDLLRCPQHQTNDTVYGQLYSIFLVEKLRWGTLSASEKLEVGEGLVKLNQLVAAADDTILFQMEHPGGLSFLAIRRKVAALGYTEFSQLLGDLRLLFKPELWEPNSRSHRLARQLQPFLA